MSLTLYYHPLASFCWKVLVALYENGTAFEKRPINLGDPADRAELEAIWPLTKFPVIRDHIRQRDIAETSIIIEYLDHYWPGQQPLIAQGWDEALQARFWDRVLDNYVQGPMQQIVADRMRNTGLDLSKERTVLLTAYRLLDQQLGHKSWIGGQGFGLADCAAAPALFYASTLEVFPEGLHNLSGYFERLMARASVQRVIEEAQPFFAYYPFAERIPPRFRGPQNAAHP
jgi:glutathione S-transferase